MWMLNATKIIKAIRLILCIQFFIVCTRSVGQVGIGTLEPNSDAILDITSSIEKPGGLLLPRLNLINVNSPNPLQNHVEGMVVYHLGENGIPSGFYYNNGSQWVQLSAEIPASDEFWTVLGNSGTDPNINFIGTINNRDFWVRTDGEKRFVFTTFGELRAENPGTEEAPTYSWTGPGNESSGIFLPETSTIGFSTDGIERFRIPPANQVYAMADGTEEAPFYSWNSAQGTGIWKPVDDGENLAFSVNKQEKFRITSNSQLLGMQVTTNSRPTYSWGTASNTGMYLSAANTIGFTTNGTERFRIPDTDQVYAMNNASSTRPFYSWEKSPGTGIWRSTSGGASIQGLSFSVNEAEKFKMTHGGQLLFMGTPTTASNPTYSWNNRNNTGMFLLPDGPAIGFSTGGTERVRITNNQILAGGPHATTTPFYSWKEAPGTGMGRNNDNLTLWVDNTEKFRITTDGQLQQNNTNIGNPAKPSYSWEAYPTTGIFLPEENIIGFSTDGVERLRIPNHGQLFAMGPGTETAPFYSWIDTPTSGIWAPVDSNGNKNNIAFSTESKERMRINYNGQVLINTTTSFPIGNDWAWLEVESSLDETAIRGKTSGSGGIAIYGTDANAGPSNGWAGYFQGNVEITGSLSQGSDRRFKTNITSLKNENRNISNKVMALKPKSYNWRINEFSHLASHGDKKSFGFIAQEFKELFPELVSLNTIPGSGSSEEYFNINYIEIIPLLTQTIQDQQEIIDKQEERINRLEAKIDELLKN